MADFFDALEKPPTVEQITPAPKPAGDVFDALENPVQAFAPQFLAGKLRDRTTWAEVEPELKKLGADPEQYRQGYQLDEARAVQKGEGVGVFEQFGRKSIPFVSGLIGFKKEKEYTEALGRYQKGQGTAGDAATIARYERLQQIDQEQAKTFGGMVTQAASSLPALLGEAGVAGKVVGAGGRLLGLGRVAAPPLAAAANPSVARLGLNYATRTAAMTPLMPSMYLEQAAKKNIEEGRQADDIRGFVPALGLGYANNLVLGSVQKLISPARSVRGAIGRSLGAGAVGTVEQAASDTAAGFADEFIPKAYQTGTRYGTVGQLWRGERGEALKHATVQALTFSVFAGLHARIDRTKPPSVGRPSAPAESPVAPAAPAQGVIDAHTSLVNKSADAGIPPEVTGKYLESLYSRIGRVVAYNPGLSRDAVKKQFDHIRPEFRDDVFKIIDALPEAEPAPRPEPGAEPPGRIELPMFRPNPLEAAIRQKYETERVNPELDDLFAEPVAPRVEPVAEAGRERANDDLDAAFGEVSPTSEVAQRRAQIDRDLEYQKKRAAEEKLAQEEAARLDRERVTREQAEQDAADQIAADKLAQSLTERPGAEPGRTPDSPEIAPPGANAEGKPAGPPSLADRLKGLRGLRGSAPAPAKSATDLIRTALDAAELPPDVKAKYGETVDRVMGVIPEAARGHLGDVLERTKFYASGNEAALGMLNDVLKQPETSAEERAIVERYIKNIESGDLIAGGGYDSSGTLHIDGGMEGARHKGKYSSPDRKYAAHEVYAHEFTHGIDGPGWQQSSRPEWQEAWAEEISAERDGEYPLTDYGSETPHEGFAEFGRLLYGSDVPTATIRAEFPKASAFFEKNGWFPAERGGKAEGIREIFDTRIGDPAKADHLDAATKELAEKVQAGDGQPAEPPVEARPGADLPLPVLRELAEAAGVKWQGEDAAGLLDALEGSKKGKAVLAAELAERGETRPQRTPERVEPPVPAGDEPPARFGQSFRDQVNDAVNKRVLSAEEGFVVDEILAGKSFRKIELLRPNGRPYKHTTVANRLRTALERLGASKELVAEIKRVQALDAVERIAKGEEVTPEELAANPEEVGQRVQEAESQEAQKLEELGTKLLKEYSDAVAEFKQLGVRDPEARAREVVRSSQGVPAGEGAARPAEGVPAEAPDAADREAPSPVEVVNKPVAADAWRAEQRRLREAREAEAKRKADEKAAKEAEERAAVEQRKAARAAAAEARRQAEKKRKKYNAADRAARSESLVKQIQLSGGLKWDSAMEAHFGSKKEALEDGLPAAVFKDQYGRPGRGSLDTLTEELYSDGYISEADTGLVIEMLQGRKFTNTAELGHRHEKAADDYYRRQQEEADYLAEQARERGEEPAESPDGERVPDAEFNDPGDAFEGDLGGGLKSDFGDVPFSGFPFPRLANAISRAIIGRARGKDPAWAGDQDPNTSNPRELPPGKVVKRAAFNQVFARNQSRPQIALTAHAWAKKQSGELANAWELAHKHLDAAFPVDARTGEVALANGQRGFMEDVIKAELAQPMSQFAKLTPEQRQAIDIWRGVWAKQLKAMEREGVKSFRDANGDEIPVADLLKKGYFPRPAVEESAVGRFLGGLLGRTAGPSSLPGTKPGYRKSRAYPTEEAGAKAGVRYKGSFSERVAQFIRDTNREIADTRLANDKLLGGEDTVEPFFKRLLAQNKDVLDALPTYEREQLVKRLRGLASAAATGNVHVAPAFRGKTYPAESKAAIEAMFGERGGKILGAAGVLSQELRSLVLSLDASFATLQLQSMMFSNPVRWARTMAKAPQALLSPDLLPRLLRERPEYRQAVDEMTQSGGSAGTKPEQVGGAQAGESLIGRLPVFKQAQRMFSTLMDIAKIELWIANRPANPREWPRAVEALENSLGQGRMEQLGMSPERSFLERLLLLAPAYYRGYVALLPQLGQGGAAGRIARKQLGALTSGVLLTGLAGLYAAKAAGWITQDELEERLNPARGKFLTVPIPLGTTGKTAEVGMGGFYMSLMRAAGNAYAYQQGEKSDNPALRWYRGHAGVLPRLGWDAATGRDYGGNPTGVTEAVGRSLAPLPVQQMLMGEAEEQGTTGQRAAATAGGLIGLRAYPGSDAGRHLDRFRAFVAGEGKDFGTLSIQEKARLQARFEKTNPPPAKPRTVGAVEGAMAADQRRVERLTAAVNPESLGKLKALGKNLPGYDPDLSYNGRAVRLTRPQQLRYESLLADEYDRAVAKWDVPRMQGWAQKRRDEYMEEKLKDAKERAKTRLLRESAQQARLGLGLR